MTVTTTTNKAVYQGNGATTVWGFNFSYPDTNSISVSLINNTSGNVTVIPAINYTIVGLTPTSGQVTYPLSGSPVPVGFTLVIERIVALVQQTDLTNQGGVYPQDIEDALDYLTMEVQQIADKQNRSIVFSAADATIPPLPVPTARAGLFLAFDSFGNPIAVAGINPSVTVSAAMIPVVTAATTAAALTALGIPGALLDLLIPSGTEWDYNAGGAAPTGFVYPIGQACTSAYPDYRAKLIAAGSPYGNNGTDPLMPDKRGVVNAGKGNMGGTDNGLLPGGTVLGAVLGGANRTLIAANLPAWTPTFTGISDVVVVTANATFLQTDQNLLTYNISIADQPRKMFQTSANTAVNPPVSSGSFLPRGTINSNGGSSTAFSVLQPTFVCNKILKVH